MYRESSTPLQAKSVHRDRKSASRWTREVGTPGQSESSLSQNIIIYVWLLVVVLLGGALRLREIALTPLWGDEAESAINALTVLRDGVPRGDYLNMPIFENTLIRRSEGHPEYEFSDVSYSPSGLALYHGWLPLYAIATSFRMFGIIPDAPQEQLIPRHDAAARRLRTAASRAPSVLFSTLTLVVLFYAGSDLFGRRGGLIAATFAAFSHGIIYQQQQVRYYSATVLISLLVGWMLWRMVRRGHWKYYVFAGLTLSALFHTHVLCFTALCLLGAGCAYLARQHPQAYMKIGLLAVILLALCVPWLLLTGYFLYIPRLPSAWSLLSIRDVTSMFALDKTYVLSCVFGAAVLIVLLRFAGSHTVLSLKKSLHPLLPAFVFCGAWVVSCCVLFLLFAPAVSFYTQRLLIVILAPTVLLFAGCITLLAQAVPVRIQSAVALILVFCLTAMSNLAYPGPTPADIERAQMHIGAAVDHLTTARLTSPAKVYATPGDNLVLTFYTGIPVQSIAPVRSVFLNSYSGRVMFFERAGFTPRESDPATADRVMLAARQAGYSLSSVEARDLSWQIAWARPRAILKGRVARVEPAAASLPPFAISLVAAQTAAVERREQDIEAYHRNVPLFRGFRIRNVHDMWTVFFYRFVDVANRQQNLPYAERLRTSTARLLQSDWIVYDSVRDDKRVLPGKAQRSAASVEEQSQ